MKVQNRKSIEIGRLLSIEIVQLLWTRGKEKERKWDNKKSSEINCGDGGTKMH